MKFWNWCLISHLAFLPSQNGCVVCLKHLGRLRSVWSFAPHTKIGESVLQYLSPQKVQIHYELDPYRFYGLALYSKKPILFILESLLRQCHTCPRKYRGPWATVSKRSLRFKDCRSSGCNVMGELAFIVLFLLALCSACRRHVSKWRSTLHGQLFDGFRWMIV